jgi:hypothetical protein
VKREEKRAAAQRIVDAWNEKHPVGTPVLVRPVITQAPTYKSRTRSEAWIMGTHASVMIEGKAGGYILTALDVVIEEEWASSPLPYAGAPLPRGCTLVFRDGHRVKGTEETVRTHARDIAIGDCRVTYEEVASE